MVLTYLARAEGASAAREGEDAFRYTTVTPSETQLNTFGADGWELVTSYLESETAYPNFGSAGYVTGIQPNVRPQRLVLVFKRRATRSGRERDERAAARSEADRSEVDPELAQLYADAGELLEEMMADGEGGGDSEGEEDPPRGGDAAPSAPAAFVHEYGRPDDPLGGRYSALERVPVYPYPGASAPSGAISPGTEFVERYRQTRTLTVGRIRATEDGSRVTTYYGRGNYLRGDTEGRSRTLRYRAGEAFDYLHWVDEGNALLRDGAGHVWLASLPHEVEREPVTEHWMAVEHEGEVAWINAGAAALSSLDGYDLLF